MKKTLIFSILISSCIFLSSCKGGGDTESLTEQTKSVTGQSGTVEVLPDSTSEPIPAVSEEESYFWKQDNTLLNADPIDKSLDCKGIILDRAASLQTLMSSYLSYDKNSLAFELGEYRSTGGEAGAYKVISDEFDSYEGFRELFSDWIYEGYIDKICSWNPRICEMDNELYFVEPVGGYIGTLETWYLGFDVADDRIVGHFARLKGVEAGTIDAEYLNDESNYSFYDITVQNIDGKYVLTDCRGEDNDMYYRLHGWCYNSGAADRSLITNEKVKPVVVLVGDFIPEYTNTTGN